MNDILKGILRLAFWTFIGSAEVIKLLAAITCECTTKGGQPFNEWFFPAFQQPPYTFWFHYHGITWLAGPYSLVWYGLNAPAVFGYWGFYAYLLTIDSLFTAYLSVKNKPWTISYALFSGWFVLYDPVDFFIVLLIFLGARRWWALIAAPFLKLPIGAPAWVWDWVFTNTNSLRGVENWGRYAILGILWSASLALLVRTRRTHRKADQSKLLTGDTLQNRR